MKWRFLVKIFAIKKNPLYNKSLVSDYVTSGY